MTPSLVKGHLNRKDTENHFSPYFPRISDLSSGEGQLGGK
jgi:hypothetical protein